MKNLQWSCVGRLLDGGVQNDKHVLARELMMRMLSTKKYYTTGYVLAAVAITWCIRSRQKSLPVRRLTETKPTQVHRHCQ